jgi:putative ABC transport system substrate-binding protein
VLAQAQPKGARIGFLHFGSRQSALETGRYGAFVQGMRELGYVERANLVIEARFADGNAERISALADDLARLKVAVIVATGSPVYRVLHYTTTIPVVITVVVDPVGDGYAASLARPGGNITGLTLMAADLGPKLLELLRASGTRATRVAVLVQPGNVSHPPQFMAIVAAAQPLGIQTVLAQADSAAGIEREFAMVAKERVGAVVIITDGFFVQEARLIAAQALRHRLPSISGVQGYAGAGGLMSYGANPNDNFRRAASYVDKILKGAKPGDLPFEQPTKFELVINLKTAKALGLTIPPSLLLRADEVIE